MVQTYEIPMSARPQSFQIQLAGVAYQLTLIYRDADQAGWTLDIADSTGVPMIAGIPLVTGADLLAQYTHLGIGGMLAVATDGDMYAVPTFNNIGTLSHIYFQAS